VSQTQAESVHFSGVASDGDAVRDVFITVYNPSRNLFGDREKVFYQASTDPTSGQLEFAVDVPLTPGNNIIEVHARQNDDVVAVKRMWVLRTSGLAEQRAKENRFSANGQLRVDTFQ
jgi:carboxyl-terminal processing protease